MCGIAGFIDRTLPAAEALPILQQMTRAMKHRGPDDEGYWQSGDGINLGHRRLAILDLSPAGHQPMATPDGTGVLSYNGEIYNFPELKANLAREGAQFRGTSDTEVLLRALAGWGVEQTLRRLNGMFAFAYWDRARRRLAIARDRFGEKPLYYALQDGRFLFASELKALVGHPQFRRKIDPAALAAYMRFNYVPWPHTIFSGVYKLPPAHWLEFDFVAAEPAVRPYWRLAEVIEGRERDPRTPTDPGLVEELDALLTKAVGARMLADVPLGAFLSGGIDSSTVVALMQKQSGRPVKTFNIGFGEAAYDEAEDAAAVARHLGTEHHAHRIDSAACIDVIGRLGEIYDEPFADSSQIPTTLVSLFTRRHVTVALSGDAGDELFGGYNRYTWARRIWNRAERWPRGARAAFGGGAQMLSAGTWDSVFSRLNPLLPVRLRVRGAGDKLHKLGTSVTAHNAAEFYRRLVSQWQNPATVMARPTAEARSALDEVETIPGALGEVERMMYLDLLTYLPSDILTKVDRASMSTSLEARVPLLDNAVVAFAWGLPLETKIFQGVGKWPLRQVLKRYVPDPLFERPKTGFTLPIGEWLRGPLRGWAEDLLGEHQLRNGGFFDAKVVRREWQQHLNGRTNRQHTLWGVLMFQAWLRQWGGGIRA